MKNNILRVKEMDVAKGIAISLVVLGHIVATKPPEGNEWYMILHNLLYEFHMPFFMFVSGFIMYRTLPEINDLSSYKKYLLKKTARLVPAFLFFGILVGFGKYLLKGVMTIDNVSYNLWEGILNIVILPSKSYSESLWYIYVLTIYYITMPVLLVLVRHDTKILIILSLAAHFFRYTQYFAIDRVVEYMFIFSLGMGISVCWGQFLDFVVAQRPWVCLAFILSFFSLSFNLPEAVTKLIIGVCSIPAIFSLVSLPAFINSALLNMFGFYTFSIYLMNTIFIGLSKGLILKFCSWDGGNFLWIAPVLLVSGIFLPIFVKTVIFRRVPFLNFITN